MSAARLRILFRAYFVLFFPRRVKELLSVDTSFTRVLIGIVTFLRGVTLFHNESLDMAPEVLTALSQFIALDTLGTVAMCLGAIAVFNAFFQIRNRHLRIIEHFGMILFWAILSIYSFYGSPITINYQGMTLLSLWVAARIEDDA